MNTRLLTLVLLVCVLAMSALPGKADPVSSADSRITQVQNLCDTAYGMEKQKNWKEASTVYSQALAQSEKLAKGTISTEPFYWKLGDLSAHAGNIREAETYYQHARNRMIPPIPCTAEDSYRDVSQPMCEISWRLRKMGLTNMALNYEESFIMDLYRRVTEQSSTFHPKEKSILCHLVDDLIENLGQEHRDDSVQHWKTKRERLTKMFEAEKTEIDPRPPVATQPLERNDLPDTGLKPLFDKLEEKNVSNPFYASSLVDAPIVVSEFIYRRK